MRDEVEAEAPLLLGTQDRVDAASSGTAGPVPGQAADDGALWAGFASARSATEFCESWLALQCGEIPGATAGLLLLAEGAGRFTPAAVWPDRSRDLAHLVETAQGALSRREGAIVQKPTGAQVAYPIEVGGQLQGLVIVEVRGQSGAALTRALRRLHWGVGWLETLFRRREAERDRAQIARTSLALDMLAAAAEHPHPQEAGLAVTTGLAARLGCSRVSMGVAKGRGIRLLAMSHQATFQKRAQIVDALENAMEEAFDQDATVAHPPTPGTRARIALAQADLARHAAAATVASVPLASAGRPVGVLTLEREAGPSFTDDELAQMGAIAVALGPLVEARAKAQRLLAGSLVDRTGAGIKALIGPRRPGLKLAAAAALAAIAVLVLATGPFRVSARAVIEGTVERAAAAPFDGFVAEAPVRAGDLVGEGQILARLDDRELALEAARWRAERDQQALKYQEAIGRQDRTQAQVIAAQQKQAEAELALVEDKIARAEIRAPFRGVVVSGDLTQSLGAPVEIGKVLFEVAPLDSFRVVLQVEERDIPYLRVGATGMLRLVGRASDRVPVTITKITPVTSTEDGANTFRVEADLTELPGWIRPGMQGLGKIEVDRRPLIWIWSRSLVDWARLALWKWWP